MANYINDYFYKPLGLTAICNKTDDPKLKDGGTYQVTRICVLRAETRFFLADYPDEERNDSFNFTFLQDGEEINVNSEIRFWEPATRENKLRENMMLCNYTECLMIAEQYLNCSPALFKQREEEITRILIEGNPARIALRSFAYDFIKSYLTTHSSDERLHDLNEKLKTLPKGILGIDRAIAYCSLYASEHKEVLDDDSTNVLRLPVIIGSIYVERMEHYESKFQKATDESFESRFQENTKESFFKRLFKKK